MPTRPPRAAASHRATRSPHPSPPFPADRPIVGQAGAALNLRDLVMDDVRTATRLARLSGVTAGELKTEIDRGFRAARGGTR
jgi:hypothetical protein